MSLMARSESQSANLEHQIPTTFACPYRWRSGPRPFDHQIAAAASHWRCLCPYYWQPFVDSHLLTSTIQSSASFTHPFSFSFLLCAYSLRWFVSNSRYSCVVLCIFDRTTRKDQTPTFGCRHSIYRRLQRCCSETWRWERCLEAAYFPIYLSWQWEEICLPYTAKLYPADRIVFLQWGHFNLGLFQQLPPSLAKQSSAHQESPSPSSSCFRAVSRWFDFVHRQMGHFWRRLYWFRFASSQCLVLQRLKPCRWCSRNSEHILQVSWIHEAQEKRDQTRTFTFCCRYHLRTQLVLCLFSTRLSI